LSEAIASVAYSYKWTHHEVMHLTVKQFCVYLRYVKKFEAYEQLRMFDAAIYPDVDENARRELLQKYLSILSVPLPPTKPKNVEASWESLRAGA